MLRALEDAFVSVADRATPAVVNVSVKSQEGRRRPTSPRIASASASSSAPSSSSGFSAAGPPREDTRATGSGVIVDAKGYILTNNHVVENAETIEVRLSDDRKFKAAIVGRDPKTDLAVLKIDAASPALPVAELGNSDKIRAGQWAIAIGNPFGLDRTVTIGHISATGRTQVGVATYEAFIQTDASINPGNSGGPLLNIEGKVIGINTAIVSTGQGIGFSIPINMAREIMTQLIAKGRVVRGWLGIVIQELTPELAEGFGVKGESGVLVADVMKESPAEAAGLRAGDIIVEFDGGRIKDVVELQRRVAAVAPGPPDAARRLARPRPHAAHREDRRAAGRGSGRGARPQGGDAGAHRRAPHARGRAALQAQREVRRGGDRGGAGQLRASRRGSGPATPSSR